MELAFVQAFNALGAAQRHTLYPSSITFPPKPQAWAVCMGPLTKKSQMDQSTQGFIYMRDAVVHFPVNSDFIPKLNAQFVRAADAICPVATTWVIDRVVVVPNEVDLLLEVSRG